MKKPFYIFYLLLTLSFVRCEYTDNRLKIANNWNKSIFVEVSSDTLFLGGYNSPVYYLNTQFESKQTKIFFMKGTWSDYIKRSQNGKISFYFFNVDTLKKYMDMKFIVSHQLYLKRMDFSEEDLKKMNWNIVFNK